MQFNVYTEIVSIIERSELADLFLMNEDAGACLFTNLNKQKRITFIATQAYKLRRLQSLSEPLFLEIKVNGIDSVKKTKAYCQELIELFDNKFEALCLLLKNLDVEKKVKTKIDIVYINKILNLSLKKLLEDDVHNSTFFQTIYLFAKYLYDTKQVVLDYDFALAQPDEIHRAATKLLYLEFSGMLMFQKMLLEVRDDKPITNVKLAKTLAFLCNEKSENFKTLLTQISGITQGRPFPKQFPTKVLEDAIGQLTTDGFEVTVLERILTKMHK